MPIQIYIYIYAEQKTVLVISLCHHMHCFCKKSWGETAAKWANGGPVGFNRAFGLEQNAPTQIETACIPPVWLRLASRFPGSCWDRSHHPFQNLAERMEQLSNWQCQLHRHHIMFCIQTLHTVSWWCESACPPERPLAVLGWQQPHLQGGGMLLKTKRTLCLKSTLSAV